MQVMLATRLAHESPVVYMECPCGTTQAYYILKRYVCASRVHQGKRLSHIFILRNSRNLSHVELKTRASAKSHVAISELHLTKAMKTT